MCGSAFGSSLAARPKVVAVAMGGFGTWLLGGLVSSSSLGDVPVSSLLCKCSNNISVKCQPAHLTAFHL